MSSKIVKKIILGAILASTIFNSNQLIFAQSNNTDKINKIEVESNKVENTNIKNHKIRINWFDETVLDMNVDDNTLNEINSLINKGDGTYITTDEKSTITFEDGKRVKITEDIRYGLQNMVKEGKLPELKVALKELDWPLDDHRASEEEAKKEYLRIRQENKEGEKKFATFALCGFFGLLISISLLMAIAEILERKKIKRRENNAKKIYK